MSRRDDIFLLVRDPNESHDEDGVRSLTWERLREMFPDTAENLLQEGNLLVRHPYLNPKFKTKLLSAGKLYEALREEAELEFCQAIMELGATEITLVHTQGEASQQTHKGKVSGSYGAAEGSLEVNHAEKLRSEFERHWKVVLQSRNLDPALLDAERFFGRLVYNKDNRTLKLLFDQIKAGARIREFQLEFNHVTERNRSLEMKIEAKYANLCSCQVNFESQYEANRVERALLNAQFTFDGSTDPT